MGRIMLTELHPGHVVDLGTHVQAHQDMDDTKRRPESKRPVQLKPEDEDQKTRIRRRGSEDEDQ